MEVGNIYIDSVNSDQSEIVIEEIEINTESGFLLDAADEEYVLQIKMVSPNFKQISASELQKDDANKCKKSDRFNLCHKELLKPMVQSSSVQPAEKYLLQTLDLGNTSTLMAGNMIKKVLVLQPSDDEKAITAKAVDEIMTSLNQRAANEIAESAHEETIVEIISIKTGGRQNPNMLLKAAANPNELPNQRVAFTSQEPIIVSESFRRELDSPTCHLSYSKFRTPSPAGSGDRLKVGTMGLENVSADCYFDSQMLSVKLDSPERTELKSVENRIIDLRSNVDHSVKECSASYFSRRMKREQFEHDCGINIAQKGFPEQVKYDVQQIQPLVSKRDSNGMMPGTLKPFCLVQNQLSADKVKEHEKDRDRRPPYSYVQLIQLALCSKADQRMTLREIYEWVENRFSYYKHHKNPGWKNSIRHSLSLSEIFVRKKTGHNGRSGSAYWTLDAARISDKRDGGASLKLNNGKNAADCVTRMSRIDGRGTFQVSASDSITGSFLQPISAITSTGLDLSLQNDVSIMPYEETIEQNHTLVLAKLPSRKRGLTSEIRYQDKKQKYSLERELICSSVSDATTLFHVTADSSIVDQNYVCDDEEQLCSAVGGTEAPKREISEVLADSTSERRATATCASELLRWSDRRMVATTSQGLPKPKLYRHHRRKQDLRVLRTPSEFDSIIENSKLEGVVSDSRTPLTSQCDFEDATKSVAICLVKTPNKEDVLHTPKDEEDISHMLFTPFKTSGGALPYLSWVSPMNDLSPISSNPSLLLTPSGLDSAWAVSGLDSVRAGATTPCQLADGTPYTTPIFTKLLWDCLNGRASCADVKLDNRSFCSLLGDEIHEHAEDTDSDFISNLFTF